MTNKLIGWMAIKNTLMTYRYSKPMEFNDNAALISSFLQAVNYYSKALTKCDIQSITYFENAEKTKGLSFRLSNYDNDLLSVVIDEVDSKEDDFLFFEDTRSDDLIKIFYEENKRRIDDRFFDIKPLREATMKGEFSKKYEEFEKLAWKGQKNYESLLLKIYGVVYKNDKKNFFQKNENEFYNVRHYKMSDSDNYSEEQLMKLINSLNGLESELFMKNEIKESSFFYTMHNKEGVNYSIAEYKNKSKEKPDEFDSIGVVLKINERANGKPLVEKIKAIQNWLPNKLYAWLD